MKRVRRFAVVGVIGLVIAGVLGGPAFATPDNVVQQIRGQGSDTTIFVMQGLDTAYNNADGCAVVAATGATQRFDQVCQVNGPPFDTGSGFTENWDHDVALSGYPLGSGNGIKMLQNFGSPGYPKIDYARSSSKGSGQAGLRFVAFAMEGLPWAAFLGNIKPDSDPTHPCAIDRSAGAIFDDNGPLAVAHGGTNGPGGIGTAAEKGTWPVPPGALTTCAAATPAGSIGGGGLISGTGVVRPDLSQSQIQDIFGCPASGHSQITDWHTLVSAIPAGTELLTFSAQDGSGTRKTFDTQLGTTDCSKAGIPSQFKNSDLNDGNRVIFENIATPISGTPDTTNGGRQNTCTSLNRVGQTVPDCALSGGGTSNSETGTGYPTPIHYTQAIYYFASGHWFSDPTQTTSACSVSCSTANTGNVLNGQGMVIAAVDGIAPTKDKIGTTGLCSNPGVTGCFVWSRQVFNVYRNAVGTDDAPDWVRDYIGEKGWICKPDAAHGVDPFTGVNYGTEINDVIDKFGFVKIPDSTSADIGQGVIAPLGTKCRVQQ